MSAPIPGGYKARRDAIISAYNAGETMSDIAAKHGVDKQMVAQLLWRCGARERPTRASPIERMDVRVADAVQGSARLLEALDAYWLRQRGAK